MKARNAAVARSRKKLARSIRKLRAIIFLTGFFLTTVGSLFFCAAMGGAYLADRFPDLVGWVGRIDQRKFYFFLLVYLILSWGAYFRFPATVRERLCEAFPTIFNLGYFS